MITDIDIVTTQLLIAQGLDLHKEIGLPQQEEIKLNGSAIQCRITTEDPLNNFLPDTGKIDTYRSPGGFWCAFRCRECLFWLRCDALL